MACPRKLQVYGTTPHCTCAGRPLRVATNDFATHFRQILWVMSSLPENYAGLRPISSANSLQFQ